MDAMRSRSTVTCTTHKLNALNSRLGDATADCLVLTEQVGHLTIKVSADVMPCIGQRSAKIPGPAPLCIPERRNACIDTKVIKACQYHLLGVLDYC